MLLLKSEFQIIYFIILVSLMQIIIINLFIMCGMGSKLLP